MSNIQKVLTALQPYVLGIRYSDGMLLVDVVFKDGWSIIDDPKIKKARGNDEINYYMLYSEDNIVGADEMLDYVDRVIKLNQEREKKHELLKEKINELQTVFKKNSLAKLNKLRFTFADDEIIPSLKEFDVDETNFNEDSNEIVDTPSSPEQIEMTEEEIEMVEEEKRANNYLEQMNKTKKINRVELPPKVKINDSPTSSITCQCSEDEACEKCIDNKGF